MMLLFKTPVGFALFKVLDEGKLSNVEDLGKEFSSPDSARKMVKLKAFDMFEKAYQALHVSSLNEYPSERLLDFLKANCDDGEVLAVANSKLGNAIKVHLKIDCVNAVMELQRGVRRQFTQLVSGSDDQDCFSSSYSLRKNKINSSDDKLDAMTIQIIALLDDVDEDLDTFVMMVRHWYGCHFPELDSIISDGIQYVKSVKLMGDRINAAHLDFSEILSDKVEADLKEAAQASIGTQFLDLDINVQLHCDKVLTLVEYRAQLYAYLKIRMNIIAPTLTAFVGELIAARLIAHKGSLSNLLKLPRSTIQILAKRAAKGAPKHMPSLLEARLRNLEARLRNLEGKDLSDSAKGKPKIEVSKIEVCDEDKKKIKRAQGTFYIHVAVGVLAILVFIWFLMPETIGHLLEEIQKRCLAGQPKDL